MPQTLNILRENCPKCGAIAKEKSSVIDLDIKWITLECGHEITQKIEEKAKTPAESLESVSGHHLFPFQAEDTDRARESGFRCLLNYDVGLGKTPTFISILRLYPELLPALVVTKGNLILQTEREIYEWMPEMTGRVQVLNNGKEPPLPFIFPICISSYSLLARVDWLEQKLFKTLIIDECQYIKNLQSGMCKNTQKIGKKLEHILALSADPIKNNALEFFPILNLLDSRSFPSQTQFAREWVGTYDVQIGENGKRTTRIGGIRKYRLKEFHQRTEGFIFRRSADDPDVNLQLPKVLNDHKFVEFPPELEASYRLEMAKFLEADAEGEFEGTKGQISLLGYLAKLSHITGVAKAPIVAEFAGDVLASTMDTGKKLVIFAHHKDVAGLIQHQLTQYIKQEEILDCLPPEYLDADLDKYSQDKIEERFKTDTLRRVMIAGAKSSSEGKNWQICDRAIIAERNWTSVDESQMAGRFRRIGSKAERINIHFFNVLGTPDEYKHELTVRKAALITESKTGEALKDWDQGNTMKELLGLIRTKGRKRWSL